MTISTVSSIETPAPLTQISLEDVTLRFRNHGMGSRRFKQAVLDVLKGRQKYEAVPEFSLFEHLNVSIQHGERVGIIGGNGSGKTTLLKLISGIYHPTRGTIRVRGRISPLIELGAGFNIELSARENILLNGAFLGFSRSQMTAKTEAILDFAELHEAGDMPIKYYSSGMMLRLSFSIATDVEPEILLIDEIFGAGDASFVERATTRMHELLDHSHIAIFVSHNLELIKDMCTRAIWLDHGRIKQEGDSTEVCHAYLNYVHEQHMAQIARSS